MDLRHVPLSKTSCSALIASLAEDPDEIWRRTQIPDLHERWDLRFTAIDYLPGRSEDEPQRFVYSTRIGFGLRIEGRGESMGGRDDITGLRTSSLKVWSSDEKSLIEEGSGYWQYVPTTDGVRFLTWYDYRTRFGPVVEWSIDSRFDGLSVGLLRGASIGFGSGLIEGYPPKPACE
jgi:hypothetical protein